MSNKLLGKVSVHPVKSFFVHMLTRDISLQDAILDLLDNSVDGIQRSASNKVLEKKKPYDGYWAKLLLSEDGFSIEDNCGGIPWENHEYAFRLGRANEDIIKGRRTVGTYGIGMKRAIFKIGSECIISTHSKDQSYRVEFSEKWLTDENLWDIDALEIPESKIFGTKIEVSVVNDAVKVEFASDVFLNSFRDAIATHYAYIIQKGFKVAVNGREVKPNSVGLLFQNINQKKGDDIRPFIYEATHDGVDVFLAVGLTAPPPSKDEADQSLENYQEKYSSAEAGWTVICNDRTVLYCDKTAVTGWGVSGVPQFHTQFIAISGIAVFTSDHPDRLPTTTTKRGINASSSLYMHVRDKMIEGMKLFTQYTNLWKTKELVTESRSRLKDVATVELERLREYASGLSFATTRGAVKGKQYKPDLPRPVVTKTAAKISFTRPLKEIKKVSLYLFETANKEPREVGEKCFEQILEEAVQ